MSSYGQFAVNAILPCVAGGDIPRGALVGLTGSGNEIVTASPTAPPVGIAIYAAAEGSEVDIALAGEIPALIEGQASAGDWLYAGSGLALTADADEATGPAIARALVSGGGVGTAGETLLSVFLNIVPPAAETGGD